jgi:hypothetical protein
MLQVDPWANLYRIAPSEEFSIVAESDTANPRIDVDRYNGTDLIVTLLDSSEFYVVQAGERLHHLRDYRTNVEGM